MQAFAGTGTGRATLHQLDFKAHLSEANPSAKICPNQSIVMRNGPIGGNGP